MIKLIYKISISKHLNGDSYVFLQLLKKNIKLKSFIIYRFWEISNINFIILN